MFFKNLKSSEYVNGIDVLTRSWPKLLSLVVYRGIKGISDTHDRFWSSDQTRVRSIPRIQGENAGMAHIVSMLISSTSTLAAFTPENHTNLLAGCDTRTQIQPWLMLVLYFEKNSRKYRSSLKYFNHYIKKAFKHCHTFQIVLFWQYYKKW